MEHKQTSVSLPGYYICDAANGSAGHVRRRREGHGDDFEMCAPRTGKQLHISSSIRSSVKGCEIQSSRMSPGTWLAVAGDQAESAQGFCQTEGKCFHLEEHLVSL